MANEYYERLSEMNPGDLADGLAMEAEFDAISQGFSKLPTPHTGGQGFDGPVRVGDAQHPDEAVTKAQLDKALGKAKSLAIATYGDLNAEAWATLDSGTYLLFGTGAQLINFPAALVAGATYYVTVRHAVGDVGVSLYLDELAFASTDDAANVDLGRSMVRVGADLAAAISAGWKKAQPLDATLSAMAGVVTAADKFIYFDGVDSAKSAPLTAFARTLLDDADAATARVTLEAAPGGYGLGEGSLPRAGNADNLLLPGWATYNVDSGDINGPSGHLYGIILVASDKNNAIGYIGWASQIFFSNSGLVFVRNQQQAGSMLNSVWHRVYSQNSILGTVSQTNGNPTGAIIERGSNANGEYTKFADGTLICRGRAIAYAPVINNCAIGTYGCSFFSSTVHCTFPALFAGTANSLSISAGGGARSDGASIGGVVSAEANTLSSVQLSVWCMDSYDHYIQYAAVGSWY